LFDDGPCTPIPILREVHRMNADLHGEEFRALEAVVDRDRTRSRDRRALVAIGVGAFLLTTVMFWIVRLALLHSLDHRFFVASAVDAGSAVSWGGPIALPPPNGLKEVPLDDMTTSCGIGGQVTLEVDPAQPSRGRLTCTTTVACYGSELTPNGRVRLEFRDGGYGRVGFLVCDYRDGGQ
jgi:hypothetical protein